MAMVMTMGMAEGECSGLVRSGTRQHRREIMIVARCRQLLLARKPRVCHPLSTRYLLERVRAAVLGVECQQRLNDARAATCRHKRTEAHAQLCRTNRRRITS